MRMIVLACSALVLAACTDEPETDVDLDVMNEQALGPAAAIQPEPITSPDIEKHGLFGAGCNFKRTDNEPFLVIAQDKRAHFMLDGKLHSASSDSGSERLLNMSWSKYDGLEYTIELTIDPQTERSAGSEAVDYDGSVAIRDARGRDVFTAVGIVQCGA